MNYATKRDGGVACVRRIARIAVSASIGLATGVHDAAAKAPVATATAPKTPKQGERAEPAGAKSEKASLQDQHTALDNQHSAVEHQESALKSFHKDPNRQKSAHEFRQAAADNLVAAMENEEAALNNLQATVGLQKSGLDGQKSAVELAVDVIGSVGLTRLNASPLGAQGYGTQVRGALGGRWGKLMLGTEIAGGLLAAQAPKSDEDVANVFRFRFGGLARWSIADWFGLGVQSGVVNKPATRESPAGLGYFGGMSFLLRLSHARHPEHSPEPDRLAESEVYLQEANNQLGLYRLECTLPPATPGSAFCTDRRTELSEVIGLIPQCKELKDVHELHAIEGCLRRVARSSTPQRVRSLSAELRAEMEGNRYWSMLQISLGIVYRFR